MPEIKNIRSGFKKFLKFCKRKRKVLTNKSFQAEMINFVNAKKYNLDDIMSDKEVFQNDFFQYLKHKGYDLDGMKAVLEEMEKIKLPRNITQISEKLNECMGSLSVIPDTTNIVPGFVCYVITKIAATDKKPYVTYKPSVRVITQIHDSGVNQGAMFFTYSHEVVNSIIQKTPHIVSEEEVFYSPLTKDRAAYICKILNAQSRLAYMKCIKQQQIRETINIKHK